MCGEGCAKTWVASCGVYPEIVADGKSSLFVPDLSGSNIRLKYLHYDLLNFIKVGHILYPRLSSIIYNMSHINDTTILNLVADEEMIDYEPEAIML